MTEQDVSKYGYHPAYGLPDEVRDAILRDAETETVRVVAERYRIGESTIYRWRKAQRDG